MQIGIVAKKIGLSVDAIRFYERNSLLPWPPSTQGLPPVWGNRRRDVRFYPPRTGSRIQTQRDPKSLGAAPQSSAAVCAGAPPAAGKAGRYAAETY